MEDEPEGQLTRPVKAKSSKTVTEPVLQKEPTQPEIAPPVRKRPQTQKQLEAFQKCAQKRHENIQKNKEQKMIAKAKNVLQKFNLMPAVNDEEPKKTGKSGEMERDRLVASEEEESDEEESEEEVIVKPKKQKAVAPKQTVKATSSKKSKQIIIIGSDSESEDGETDTELSTDEDVAYSKKKSKKPLLTKTVTQQEPITASFGRSHRNAKSKVKISSTSKSQPDVFSRIPHNNFFAD